MIDILVPVLNRPERVMPLLAGIRKNTTVPGYQVWFGVTGGDELELQELGSVANILYGGKSSPVRVLVLPPRDGGDYAHKINMLFHESQPSDNPFVLLGADDLRFHPQWDAFALKAFADDESALVVGTNDMGNRTVMAGKHSTHPVLSREYVLVHGASWDGPGVVYHEGYDHQYCDTELIELAQQRDCFRFASESKVEHLHPFWGKGEMDPVYRKGQRAGQADARLFQKRKKLYG